MSPNCWNVLGILLSSTIATCYLGQRILERVSCALEMNNRISTRPYSKLPLGVKEGTDFFFLCACTHGACDRLASRPQSSHLASGDSGQCKNTAKESQTDLALSNVLYSRL